ncbi:peroxisomal leader peptide-processing protease [Trichogramma pretiosum]|uniref:peroxisomal leader peptide-processing protease n=1 Tax=Trichogramma pretiosum TaxID=7493 RepID=UPI0006C96D3C|nr:peroxisomal leader peptide-processing protease [Trichogramma pretiosum]
MRDSKRRPKSAGRCVAIVSRSHPAHGASGVLLNDGWILSHGSLLAPYLRVREARRDRDVDDELGDFFDNEVAADGSIARLPDHLQDYLRFAVHVRSSEGDVREDEASCKLESAWRCPLLRESFGGDLLFSWNFAKSSSGSGSIRSMLSLFLLLRMDSDEQRDSVVGSDAALSRFYWENFEPGVPALPCRGDPLEIESTPFGNPTFLGSVSRGILSNAVGECDCLLVTDAMAVPGSEGAPVYALQSKKKRRLCGMVIAPLSWCRGEWVDFTFAANLRACLAVHASVELGASSSSSLLLARENKWASSSALLPEMLDRSLVVVKCGPNWGTGVVLDVPSGTIITCSHVVREASGGRVKIARVGETEDSDDASWSIDGDDGGGLTAKVIYRTRDGQPYDLAVLKLEPAQLDLKALRMARGLTKKGASVLAAGYPFFGSELSASCSLGTVSRSEPAILQTTCCVQSGSSGGPVLACGGGSLAPPEIVGIVVSNAVTASGDPSARRLYPRFNMAVPVEAFREPLRRYIETEDVRHLEELSTNDPGAKETWSLYLTPRSKI